MKQIAVISVIIMLIAAVALVFFVSPSSGSDQIDGEVTVYIEDMECDQVHMATLSIGKPTLVESAMLSFGQAIRTTEMQPMFSYTTKEPIKKTGVYNVWTAARIKVTAENVAQVTDNKVWFSGHATKPSDPLYLLTGSTVSDTNKYPIIHNALTLNQETVINMAEDMNKKFTHKTPGTGSSLIVGENLDRMMLHVGVLVTIVGDDGKTYTQEKTATLDITVSSWAASTLSVSVIAMGPGSDSPAVSIMPMMLGMVSMLGMASYKMDN